MEKNIYNKNASNNRNRLQWHYYFMARMSDCPVVLTENGFMSNATDFAGILSATTNAKKAQAIAQGVADYFLSIRLTSSMAIPGDADRNGSVNNRDLGLFQRYLNDWGVAVDFVVLDMNKDGKVNNRDLGLLQQRLNQ